MGFIKQQLKGKPKMSMLLTGAGVHRPAIPASPTKTYRGSHNTNSPTSAQTATIDIGAASADRMVIVGVLGQNAPTISSVEVNGVTLNPDIYVSPSNSAGLFSGLVTSGSGPQSVVINWVGGAFLERGLFVWTLTGLSSNSVKNFASADSTTPVSINVSNGDLMFCSGYDGTTPGDYNASAEVPFANHIVGATGLGGDWTIVSSNAAFLVQATGPQSVTKVCATYR